MGSTITTTTSSPTLLRIQDPGSVLSASDIQALLTSLSRPGFKPPARPAGSSEPPTKRIRLDENLSPQANRLLHQCLRNQVFPHIDSQLATLPGDRVNTLAVGKQVVALLVGSDFAREYNSRGDGSISPEFEDRLAFLAAQHVQKLASRLGHQRVPSSTVRPAPSPRSATPIPPPSIPTNTPGPTRPAPTSSSAPRYSTSPIPPPVVPNLPRSEGNGRPNGTSSTPQRPSVSAPVESTQTPPVVITIDDDDDDDEDSLGVPAGTGTRVAVEKPVAIAHRGSLKRPLQEPESPRQARPSPTPQPTPRTLPVRPSPTTSPSAVLLSPTATYSSPASPTTDSTPTTARSPAPVAILAAHPPPTPKQAVSKGLSLADFPVTQSTRDEWEAEAKPVSKWFSKPWQPYLYAEQRAEIIGGSQAPQYMNQTELDLPTIMIHVDFTDDEVQCLRVRTRQALGLTTTRLRKDSRKDIAKLLRKNPGHKESILQAFGRENWLPGRTRDDVRNFFRDLESDQTRSVPAVLTLEKDCQDRRGEHIRSSRIDSLLFARQISGHMGAGSRCPHQLNFQNEFRKCREDDIEKKAEWTGCAGDIFTISWVSNDGFICGTTEHSDSHNQQYNKPGNLVLGSCSQLTLRAYPEHRIVRPVVEKGENSTEAMRQSQDPWLYSSVVSSSYDAIHGRAFTCSFDRTVKIWRVEKSGASMSLLGEWKHDGNVNFVVASKHESGLVATAADVAVDAVRIYNVEDDISRSPFRSYSCSRVTDANGNTVSTEKWAYYPATMQWGLAEGVKHMLLVGYSPRSRTGDDSDIPVDRRDSGELCLWDGITGERWRVTAATTQNVFEVLWHPTQECFIAATSPLGLDLEPSVRTQIRIFRPADKEEFGIKAYSPIMTLGCTAIDVNELTIMPNSFSFCYVTAGCTDGNTYVWDTARGDKPIHVLRHGEPIDEYRGDREREDVGVKFTAWGTTPDRFYTGSSDGVVKVWNVRSLDKPLVRHLLEAPAPITAGMFCPDKSRLVVGDASGRVFMLSVNDEIEQQMIVSEIPLPGGGVRKIRRPPAIIPHPDPPAPTHDAEGPPIVATSGPALGRAYLESLQLERHPDPTIGVVQGPRYAETGLFRRELHFNGDPGQPLLAQWVAVQQEDRKPPGRLFSTTTTSKRRGDKEAMKPVKKVQYLEKVHHDNMVLDEIKGILVEFEGEKVNREPVDYGFVEEDE